ncbi:MAG: ATP-binding cassette domain-containing protein [Opitutales bacterium]|nr:ATP-binding cassette domain-containing protein [Opitutales bacterium]
MPTKTNRSVEAVSIKIENLHKSYGDTKVLHGVSFDVEPGQIFSLMGPSGSGKSVMLRQLIALEKPDEGSVLIDGLDAQDPKTRDAIRTALVFQSGALMNSMTVYDNLALYHREHRSLSERDIKAKIQSVTEALSIEAALKKIPAELSGGMRKRVAVARAIIMEPRLILYDEPTSELDPILAATTSELIATVCKETGATSLVVTHDRQLALGISNRVGLLLSGHLEFIGTPDEMRSSDDERVQEFLNPKLDLENPRFRKKENAL